MAPWQAWQCEPIMGVWGQGPQQSPGAEPLVRGSPWSWSTFGFWTFNQSCKFAHISTVW